MGMSMRLSASHRRERCRLRQPSGRRLPSWSHSHQPIDVVFGRSEHGQYFVASSGYKDARILIKETGLPSSFMKSSRVSFLPTLPHRCPLVRCTPKAVRPPRDAGVSIRCPSLVTSDSYDALTGRRGDLVSGPHVRPPAGPFGSRGLPFRGPISCFAVWKFALLRCPSLGSAPRVPEGGAACPEPRRIPCIQPHRLQVDDSPSIHVNPLLRGDPTALRMKSPR